MNEVRPLVRVRIVQGQALVDHPDSKPVDVGQLFNRSPRVRIVGACLGELLDDLGSDVVRARLHLAADVALHGAPQRDEELR